MRVDALWVTHWGRSRGGLRVQVSLRVFVLKIAGNFRFKNFFLPFKKLRQLSIPVPEDSNDCAKITENHWNRQLCALEWLLHSLLYSNPLFVRLNCFRDFFSRGAKKCRRGITPALKRTSKVYGTRNPGWNWDDFCFFFVAHLENSTSFSIVIFMGIAGIEWE